MMQSRDLARDSRRTATGAGGCPRAFPALHEWLSQQDLADAQVDLRVQHLLERLHQDKLVVAFVAEFSRGKSELINAIFFADFGQRLLPSSAGRTTMCPTELLYDPTRPPSIRLLPIETRRARRDGRRIQELRRRVGHARRSICRRRTGWARRCRKCRRSSACRWRSRASTASTTTATCWRRCPRPTRRASTFRAGATRSSISRIRCCSRAS